MQIQPQRYAGDSAFVLTSDYVLQVVPQAVEHFGKVLLSASDELRENRDLSRGGAAQRPGH